ncbi:MAG: hypothetical protein HZA19_01070 [Nitrospirae bacterium]|nr:hypothetical protein [Nitrospirota bacterium]
MKQRSPFFLRTFTTKARRIWLVLFLLTILFLVLFSPEIQRKPHVALVERPLIFIMTSIHEGISWIFGGVGRFWDRYAALLSLQEENERLNTQIRRLQ